MKGHAQGSVPVSRRFMAARPVASALGAAGIGLALMLMLLLAGLWAGVRDRVTTFDDHLGADLVVVPPGTRSLFAEPGGMPASAVHEIARTPGVEAAAPLRTMYQILELPHGKAAVAVVASDPSSPLGGPWAFTRGRAPRTEEEVAVDALWAAEHELGMGDRLTVLGHSMSVVGLTDDTAVFMTPLLFTTTTGMNQMLGSSDTTGAVLVTTRDPMVVSHRLADAGFTVRTPTELREASLQLATDIYGSPVRLMVAVAFAAGTLIVALVASTRITEEQRDLGVLKALGATPARLRRLAMTQTATLTALGALSAVAFLIAGRALLAWWRPAFPVLLTPATLAQTAAAATAMAILAAWLPARRLSRMDAASAFRAMSTRRSPRSAGVRRSATPQLSLSGAVPVGRRLLLADRRRAALTVLGVAASLLLVQVLGGVFAGAIDQVTSYIRTSPADLFVSQEGVRTMHMSTSTLPSDTVGRVAGVPGVAWAAPIAFASGSVAGPQGRQLSYLIGYDTRSDLGGPANLVAGRSPRTGEAVLDEQAADRLGIHLGEPFTIMGTEVRAVGLSSGGTSITNTTVFVDLPQFARIHDDRVSYVLAAAAPGADPGAVADRIRQAVSGVTAQTRDQFAQSEARIVTDMSADLLRLMSIIGLLVALAVIALGLTSATLNRLRDFAVLKALGARTTRLAGAVTTQVLLTVAAAATLATAAALLLAWMLPLAAPAVRISVTPAALAQTTVAAVAVGLLAALWPLRRIAALDAATAFRETR